MSKCRGGSRSQILRVRMKLFILKNIEQLKKCEASILPLVDTSINVNNQHIFMISWNIIDFYLIKFKGRG